MTQPVIELHEITNGRWGDTQVAPYIAATGTRASPRVRLPTMRDGDVA